MKVRGTKAGNVQPPPAAPPKKKETVVIQKSLNTLSHGKKLAVDGIYGPKTTAEVKKFQKKQGLKADGIVGTKTAAALDKAVTQQKTATMETEGKHLPVKATKAEKNGRLAELKLKENTAKSKMRDPATATKAPTRQQQIDNLTTRARKAGLSQKEAASLLTSSGASVSLAIGSLPDIPAAKLVKELPDLVSNHEKRSNDRREDNLKGHRYRARIYVGIRPPWRFQTPPQS